MMQELCRCCSGDTYEACCASYHRSERIPANALALMRSRYSAYAKGISNYIMETTHARNPAYQKNPRVWAHEIAQFSRQTVFQKLEILDFIDGHGKAFVTFAACLKQGNRDVSFIEKSCFVKADGRWLYFAGDVYPRSK